MKKKSIKKGITLIMSFMLLFCFLAYNRQPQKVVYAKEDSGQLLDFSEGGSELNSEGDSFDLFNYVFPTLDQVPPRDDGIDVLPGRDYIRGLSAVEYPSASASGRVDFEGVSDIFPVDSKGNAITKVEVTIQAYFPGTRADIAATYPGEGCEYTSADDMGTGDFGGNIKGEIVFTPDGHAYLQVQGDIPEGYMYAITSLIDPELGISIDLVEMRSAYMFLFGDGEKSLKDIEEDPNFNPDKDPDEDPDPDKDPDKPVDQGDDGHRYHSLGISTTPYEHLTPSTSASISSNQYNVAEGIPTSENLDYSLTADNALYEITTRKYQAKAGVKNITIILTATYPQKHTHVYYDDEGERHEYSWTTIEKLSRTVTTNYSYEAALTLFDVPRSNIYPVQSGTVQATNNGNVLSASFTLAGSHVVGPQVIAVSSRNPSVSNIEYGHLGYFSSRSAARSAVFGSEGEGVKSRIQIAVHAALNYRGNTNYSYGGLRVTTMSNNGVKPTVGKASGSSTSMIPATYPNGTYVGSGSVVYAGGKSFGVSPNNVLVHTPVVNKAYISDVSEFINQKINKDKNRTYLMLDEQFTITIPNNGTHNAYKGYGNRIYNSGQGVTKLATTWGKIKDIKLPFDAYLHYVKSGKTYKQFIKANTWLSESSAAKLVSLTGTQFTFTIPVWVTEKTYEIETRVIAENAVDASMYGLAEENKNGSITNYVATKKIPVEVIGKIYDLRVSSCEDPGWANIYSSKTGKDYIAAEEFPFGQQGQNKLTQYHYAPKLGYTFVFDFKTKGRKSNNIDVSVQPEGFYFISRDGKKVEEVDLYYNTTTKSNIKINSLDRSVSLSVRLKDALYKVPAQEFVDSTRIYKNQYNYALSVKIGTFAKLNMPENLRLCYNNFAEYIGKLYGIGSTENSISQNAGSKDTVIGSVGHWYAGYRLPASTKAVSKGTDINTAIKNKTLLTDGYILVKFGIKTKYQNASGNYDYLRYTGPEALNEAGEGTGKLVIDWTKNQTQEIILPNGNKATVPVGSVALYEASLRSSNDAEVGGTH